MVDIDPITGLPKELGVWDDLVKEGQKVIVKVIRKKFGKEYTVIEGVDPKQIDVKDLAKKLKNKFACGGTGKDGRIELQGNHTHDIADVLIKEGFAPETISVNKHVPPKNPRR